MPPLAIAAALASALIHASWNAALKGGRDRVADSFLIALGGLGCGAILIALLGVPRAEAWPFIAVSVGIHLLYWLTLFKSYDLGDLSHIYTLARGSAPLLVALGAALTAREVPAPAEALGIVCVSAGVLAVGASPSAPLKATLWALACGLTIAAYSLVDALGARTDGDALRYLGWHMALQALPMMGYAIWRRGGAVVKSPAPWRGIAIGVVSIAGYGLVLWAQTFAPIAQVTALRETSVVWGALIALVFLGERLGPRRWIGALVVALGAGLIAFG
jgi:drug/metabolite transporter (DMT)-like permease